jgi:hypothetical protein
MEGSCGFLRTTAQTPLACFARAYIRLLYASVRVRMSPYLFFRTIVTGLADEGRRSTKTTIRRAERSGTGIPRHYMHKKPIRMLMNGYEGVKNSSSNISSFPLNARCSPFGSHWIFILRYYRTSNMCFFCREVRLMNFYPSREGPRTWGLLIAFFLGRWGKNY